MPISERPRLRRGTVRVAGWQRQRLGHADRVRVMDGARRLERDTYRRGRGLHGGCLRQTGLRVLWFLLFRGQGRAGATDPALHQIAAGLQIARSTVQLALRRLDAAGVLWVVQRGHVRAGRYEQVTNAYLVMPADRWASDTDLRQALDSMSIGIEEEELHPVVEPASSQEVERLAAAWGLPVQ